MIRYEVKTGFGESSNIATFYHSFDIEDNSLKLTNWFILTSLDIDKFILMDDGSELYVKISYVNGEYVRTSGGTYRTRDIVHCAVPKYKLNGYSGASAKNEHFNVRKPTKKENDKCRQVMNGKKITGRITERVKLLLLEKLQEAAKDRGFDEAMLVDEIMDGFLMRDKAGRKDPQWLNAGKILAKINGFDVELPNGVEPSKQIEQQGFQRFNNGITNVSDLKRIKIEEASIVLEVEQPKEIPKPKVTVKDINKAVSISNNNKLGRVNSSKDENIKVKEIVSNW